MGSSASLDRSPRKNWVELSGGLPPYVREIARSIEQEKGVPLKRAVPLAWAAVVRWARGGDDVNPDTRAKATKAVAQLAALRGRNAARQVTTAHVWDPRTLELARYVRTAEGAKRYGRPIGTLITKDVRVKTAAGAARSRRAVGETIEGRASGPKLPPAMARARAKQERADRFATVLSERDPAARKAALGRLGAADLRRMDKAIAGSLGKTDDPKVRAVIQGRLDEVRAELAAHPGAKPRGPRKPGAAPKPARQAGTEMKPGEESGEGNRDGGNSSPRREPSGVDVPRSDGTATAGLGRMNAEAPRKAKPAAGRAEPGPRQWTMTPQERKRYDDQHTAAVERFEAESGTGSWQDDTPKGYARLFQRVLDAGGTVTKDGDRRYRVALPGRVKMGGDYADRTHQRLTNVDTIGWHERDGKLYGSDVRKLREAIEAAEKRQAARPGAGKPAKESKYHRPGGNADLQSRIDDVAADDRRIAERDRRADAEKATASKPAEGRPLAERVRKLDDAQLKAMDDALDKKGGPRTERHAAIKAERKRREQGDRSAPTSRKIGEDHSTPEKSRQAAETREARYEVRTVARMTGDVQMRRGPDGKVWVKTSAANTWRKAGPGETKAFDEETPEWRRAAREKRSARRAGRGQSTADEILSSLPNADGKSSNEDRSDAELTARAAELRRHRGLAAAAGADLEDQRMARIGGELHGIRVEQRRRERANAAGRADTEKSTPGQVAARAEDGPDPDEVADLTGNELARAVADMDDATLARLEPKLAKIEAEASDPLPALRRVRFEQGRRRTDAAAAQRRRGGGPAKSPAGPKAPAQTGFAGPDPKPLQRMSADQQKAAVAKLSDADVDALVTRSDLPNAGMTGDLSRAVRAEQRARRAKTDGPAARRVNPTVTTGSPGTGLPKRGPMDPGTKRYGPDGRPDTRRPTSAGDPPPKPDGVTRKVTDLPGMSEQQLTAERADAQQVLRWHVRNGTPRTSTDYADARGRQRALEAEMGRREKADRSSGVTPAQRRAANASGARDDLAARRAARDRPAAKPSAPAGESRAERNARLLQQERAQDAARSGERTADPKAMTPEQRTRAANRMRMDATGADTPAQASEMRRRADELEAMNTGGTVSPIRPGAAADLERRAAARRPGSGGDDVAERAEARAAVDQDRPAPSGKQARTKLARDRLAALENTKATALRAARIKSVDDDDLSAMLEVMNGRKTPHPMRGDVVGEMQRRGMPLPAARQATPSPTQAADGLGDNPMAARARATGKGRQSPVRDMLDTPDHAERAEKMRNLSRSSRLKARRAMDAEQIDATIQALREAKDPPNVIRQGPMGIVTELQDELRNRDDYDRNTGLSKQGAARRAQPDAPAARSERDTPETAVNLGERAAGGDATLSRAADQLIDGRTPRADRADAFRVLTAAANEGNSGPLERAVAASIAPRPGRSRSVPPAAAQAEMARVDADDPTHPVVAMRTGARVRVTGTDGLSTKTWEGRIVGVSRTDKGQPSVAVELPTSRPGDPVGVVNLRLPANEPVRVDPIAMTDLDALTRTERDTPGTAANVQARQDAQGAANRRNAPGLFPEDRPVPKEAGTLFGGDANDTPAERDSAAVDRLTALAPGPRSTAIDDMDDAEVESALAAARERANRGAGFGALEIANRLSREAEQRRAESPAEKRRARELRLYARLQREGDPARRAAIQAQINEARFGSVSTSVPRSRTDVELSVTDRPKGSKPGKPGQALTDMSTEALTAAVARAKSQAEKSTGPAAQRAARVLIRLKAEQKRRDGDGGGKSRPPWLKGKTTSTSRPRGEGVTVELAQRADHVVALLGLAGSE